MAAVSRPSVRRAARDMQRGQYSTEHVRITGHDDAPRTSCNLHLQHVKPIELHGARENTAAIEFPCLALYNKQRPLLAVAEDSHRPALSGREFLAEGYMTVGPRLMRHKSAPQAMNAATSDVNWRPRLTTYRRPIFTQEVGCSHDVLGSQSGVLLTA
jgi:hypothetical protein